MDSDLIEHVRNKFKNKTNEDLLDIWVINDQKKWSAQTIDIVKDLLEERGVELPPQMETGNGDILKIHPKRSKLLPLHFLVAAVCIFWGIHDYTHGNGLIYLICFLILFIDICIWYRMRGIAMLLGILLVFVIALKLFPPLSNLFNDLLDLLTVLYLKQNVGTSGTSI